MFRRARLMLWLLALDVLAARGRFGSPLYLWAVGRASGCVEWGEPLPADPGRDTF